MEGRMGAWMDGWVDATVLVYARVYVHCPLAYASELLANSHSCMSVCRLISIRG